MTWNAVTVVYVRRSTLTTRHVSRRDQIPALPLSSTCSLRIFSARDGDALFLVTRLCTRGSTSASILKAPPTFVARSLWMLRR